MASTRPLVWCRWPFAIGAFLWCLLGAADASAQQQQKDVLVLYATRPDANVSVIGDRELPEILERGLGGRVSYYSEHLDLARFAEPRYHTLLGDFLQLKYSGQKFDLVVAMHDTVLKFLGPIKNRLFPETPLVFFTDNPETPRLPNSTGVVSPVDLVSTLALASTLQPSARKVYVISGAHERDKLFESRARAQFRGFEQRFAMTYLAGLPTADLKARLAALPSDAIVYYLVVNRDGAGESFHPLEYLADIAPSSSVPIYTWVDSAMGRGVVGGSLKSQEKQTAAVGELALRVLRGEPADTIPIASPNLQRNHVDWHQMQRWGISESALPAGTLMANKEPTLWERYKVYVVLALTLVLAQTSLIAGLLINRARRRQAEENLRASQVQLQTSYDRIRTLGGRLLDAQETERALVARELHDDVSQQLALLAIDLDLLRGGPLADRTGLAEQAWDRSQTLARSIHDLAYRLYPAKLRLIGLVPALEALQREMARSGLALHFVHDGVPASLPSDVTLCVFRVAQEALQNVLKYSGARKVSLSLQGRPEGLALTIADDGVGFDVAAAWGKGLGLISMSERLEALNGTFKIHSAPGEGTLLTLSVPLPASAPVAAAG